MKMLLTLVGLSLLYSCSSTSSLHKGDNGTRVCIDSLNNVESKLYSSILKELPNERITKHRVFNGGNEERGYDIYQTFGIDHHNYFIRYYPVATSESKKGFIIKGRGSGTMMTGPSNLSSIIENTYNSCSGGIVETNNFKYTSYGSYFKETLLADGKTWEIHTSDNEYKKTVTERGQILCENKVKSVFACSKFDNNPNYKFKCYVKCE